MQPAKPRKVKRSLISPGGKAGSLLPSPSYLVPELLIPTSHPPQQRESREVQGGNGFNQPCKDSYELQHCGNRRQNKMCLG